MEYKQRNKDGSIGEPIKIGTGLSIDEQVSSLGEQLAQEKIKGVQKDLLINSLGQTVSQLKLKVMTLKGGEA
ncbi:XkdW family protein [Lysinibacillus sp. CNPSo 3705]|uniref:XkdW family protein n=1 Tax=Lysinibacillus sp. CNPSo 3705 TaxID=3028148 RepID=UPI0023632514|nr:XkdW family protein [Lysinibacillus sp. CNPSo 3705]MDD1504237.1 XkdW family protein [Lysinibacillus sp. CNPSo 3705]